MPLFEVLDLQETALGQLCLRRRELLSRPGTIVTEVTLDHVFLMSSYHTESERALTELGLRLHEGSDLSVLVGGLGLGYTAREALASERVTRVETVELLRPVIDWLDAGWLPVGDELQPDAGFELTEGDVYARLLGPCERPSDVILIDVDHAPDEPLDDNSAAFYTADGLRQVASHLNPGGVLAVWSTFENPDFVTALEEVFDEVVVESVSWWNDLVEEQKVDTLFAGRKA